MDKNPEVLIQRIEVMTEDYSRDYIDEFIKYLTHSSPGVRIAALTGLWNNDLVKAFEPLMKVAQHDEDETVRVKALSIMGRYIYDGIFVMEEEDLPEALREEGLPDMEMVKQVRSYLESILYNEEEPDEKQRQALESLSFDTTEKEDAVIAEWIKSGTPEYRMSAIFSIGRSGEEKWANTIKEIIHTDENFDIRCEAVRAAGEVCSEKLIKDLVIIIHGTNRELTIEAIIALGKIGGEEVEDILFELTDSDDTELADYAQEALDEVAEFNDLDEDDDFDNDFDKDDGDNFEDDDDDDFDGDDDDDFEKDDDDKLDEKLDEK
ncbi:MAG: HEAT repeat domain-containing protein [bacterium]|nr:HEAT repeat domain-containing protein [bacterium]